MKKVLVVLVILTVVVTGVFAEENLTRSLSVFGKIDVGDAYLAVSQSSVEAEKIDLVNDPDVQPGGDGVRVGSWIFTAQNQAPGTEYTVDYDTVALSSSTANGSSYAFTVSEVVDLENTVGYSNGVVSFDDNGARNITQGLLVNLVTAIPAGATPANDFVGTITITLTKN